MRNENPRDASSICGEDTPRSNSAPSSRATPCASSTCPSSRKMCMHDREARIGDAAAGFDRFGIPVERYQTAVRTQLGKNGARVPAAPERRVEVNAVCANRESGYRF